MITVPQHAWLWSGLDEYAGHQRRYSRAALVSLVGSAGLRPVRVTSFVSLLLPALLLSRAAQRGKTVDPLQEFRIAPAANRVAGWMMTAERALIRAACRFRPAARCCWWLAAEGAPPPRPSDVTQTCGVSKSAWSP